MSSRHIAVKLPRRSSFSIGNVNAGNTERIDFESSGVASNSKYNRNQRSLSTIKRFCGVSSVRVYVGKPLERVFRKIYARNSIDRNGRGGGGRTPSNSRSTGN